MKTLRSWYRGKYVALDKKDEPAPQVGAIDLNKYKWHRPVLARAISKITEFYKAYWQWFWGFLLATLSKWWRL